MGLSVLSELDAAAVRSRAVPQQSFADLVRGAWQRRKGLASAEAPLPPAEPASEPTAETRAPRETAGADG